MLAHVTNDGQDEPLERHLGRVGERAGGNASAFGMGPHGKRAGLWHDLGKACEQFQDYLRKRVSHGGNHSTAGALHAARQGARAEAISIACHHTGLQDVESIRSRFSNPDHPDLVEEALGNASEVLPEIDIGSAQESGHSTDPEKLSLKIRLLHSALIDSDWLETERWERGEDFWRPDHPPLSTLAESFYRSQEKLLESAQDSELNETRARIREQCLEAADGPVGLYTAEIPTGGGKTRSLMEMALRHAEMHGQDQVIVIVPFISIIEQNAEEYRKAFNTEEGSGAVLEHHSLRELSHEERLTSETWDAPVVITTIVQAFESLFGHRNRDLRKIHRLANSVLIVDEIQALPVGVTAPTVSALQDLAEIANTTTILSSATQLPLEGPHPIIEDPASLYDNMRRVTYRFDDTEYSPEGLWAEYGQDQMLVVCNTVNDAQRVAEASPKPCFHLSTAMTPSHRSRVLRVVEHRLERGKPVRLVSTQVIEAGVDIDFPFAIRIEGPLDSIIQTAGRVNREGTLDGYGEVVVTRLEKGSNPPAPYRTGAQIVRNWMEEEGEINPNDPEWCRRFYERLYQQHDRDRHNVTLHLRDLSLKTAAEKYQIIDEDTTLCVVEEQVPSGLLEEIQEGGLSRDLLRRLQPYSVNLHVDIAEEALQRGHAVPLDPGSEGGALLWIGPYGQQGIPRD